MSNLRKAGRWGYRCLLAVELTLVFLLISGCCYFKQNYEVLSPQSADALLDKCKIIVEGHVVDVGLRHQKSWQQYVFFCWPFFAEYEGPDRYDVSVEIDKVLKG